ncbi:MAG TPA: response regulator [Pyrinomonadaceae bacterium]
MRCAGECKQTLLVVEDYDDVRQMLRMLLESEHMGVLEAANGTEALDILRNERPNAVLTDLGLPGIDGFETIRRIRKIDGFQNTPIVVLSAHSGQSIYEEAFHAGANYFIVKPVDFDELEWLITQILGKGMARIKIRENGRVIAQRAVITNRAADREMMGLRRCLCA